MSNILVTGGAGFIGSSLVKALLNSKSNHITAYDNLSKGSMENISNWFESSNFRFIQADMLDPPSIESAVNACDLVFHLAANSSVEIGALNTKIDFEQNLLATYNLLEAMRKSHSCKKMIFTSTSTIYGEVDKMPIPENYFPLKPISLYGASKLACEALISGYCHMFELSCIIVRLANIIGPTSKQGVIYDLISKLSSNANQLDILGNGMQNKSYLYITDCIDGLVPLVELVEKQSLDIYNLGSDDTITVSNIAETIIQELGLNNVHTKFLDKLNGRGWVGDVREFLLDSSKMKGTGWNARYSSKEAVICTVRDYLEKNISLTRQAKARY